MTSRGDTAINGARTLHKREQVFVSSTYEDLREERQVVTQRLLEVRCIPAGMELFPAAADDKWELIKRVIEESDYYVLIVGGRYGSLVPGGHVSYTEREYDLACSLDKPVLAFLRTDEGLRADRAERDPTLTEKLTSFRDKVMATSSVKFWSSPDQLGSQVTTAISEARELHPAEGWVKASEIRAHLSLGADLVAAVDIAGIVELSPGLGGVRDRLLFDRLHLAKRIDVFANTAYHFLQLNATSLSEMLRQDDAVVRLCLSDTSNPFFSETMPHARYGKRIGLAQALCPAKDVANEIEMAEHYLAEVIFPEARRECERHGVPGPGRIEIYKYKGVPTCGLMFVDDTIGRLVPYVPFSGSNQAPAFVFSRTQGEGRLFDYLWGRYLDILECIGAPSILLSGSV